MSIELYLTFLAAIILLGITPGPMMALLTSNILSFGMQAGMRTLAGNLLGLSVLMSCVVLGLNSIIAFMAEWFDWIKIIGAVYLIWLGITKIRFSDKATIAVPEIGNHRRFFIQGTLVALSNPKVLLFLAAFLPQFLSPAHDMQFQLIIYGISFVVALALVDLGYIIVMGKTKSVLSHWRLVLFNRLSGAALMCGGLGLLLARRN